MPVVIGRALPSLGLAVCLLLAWEAYVRFAPCRIDQPDHKFWATGPP